MDRNAVPEDAVTSVEIDNDDDGLPLVTIEGIETVSNEDAVAAIHQQRNRS